MVMTTTVGRSLQSGLSVLCFQIYRRDRELGRLHCVSPFLELAIRVRDVQSLRYARSLSEI